MATHTPSQDETPHRPNVAHPSPLGKLPTTSQVYELVNDLNDNKRSRPLRREDYDHIPNYDGNPSDLLQFIQITEDVYNVTCHERIRESDINHALLVNKIKSKLTGSALSLILTRTISTIPELLDLLKQNFSDSRSFASLKTQIYNSKMLPKETPTEYLTRLENLRHLVYAKYKIQKLEEPELSVSISFLEQEIVHHYLTTIPWQLSNQIISSDPQTLSDLRKTLNTKCTLILDSLNKKSQMTSNYPRGNEGTFQKRMDTPRNTFRGTPQTPQFQNPRFPNAHSSNYHGNTFQHSPRNNFQNFSKPFNPRYTSNPRNTSYTPRPNLWNKTPNNGTPTSNTPFKTPHNTTQFHHLETLEPRGFERKEINTINARLARLESLDHFLEKGQYQKSTKK